VKQTDRIKTFSSEQNTGNISIKLLHKLYSQSMLITLQPHRSGSPNAGNDLGLENGHDLAQRTRNSDSRTSHSEHRPATQDVTETVDKSQSNLNRKMSPKTGRKVTTQELFDEVLEEPPKSSEGSKDILGSSSRPLHAYGHTHGAIMDSFPMQESMPPEDFKDTTSSSITGLGFHNISTNDLSGEQSVASNGDLMTFSMKGETKDSSKKKAQVIL